MNSLLDREAGKGGEANHCLDDQKRSWKEIQCKYRPVTWYQVEAARSKESFQNKQLLVMVVLVQDQQNKQLLVMVVLVQDQQNKQATLNNDQSN